MDAAGNVKAVAFAGLDLSWLSRLLAESRLPENSTITAVDGVGRLAAALDEMAERLEVRRR